MTAFNVEALVKQAQTSIEEARAFEATGDNAYTRETRINESMAYSLLAICHSLQQYTNNQVLASSGQGSFSP